MITISDYNMILLSAMAEVIENPKPDRIREARFAALKKLQKNLNWYRSHSYMEELLVRIADKKCHMLMEACSKKELDLIMNPPVPHYNGNEFIVDRHLLPEEELIAWSETSLCAPLTHTACKRFEAVFREVFPEQSKAIFAAS